MSFQALLAKDVARELRSKESLQAGLVLVGLFFLLFLFTGGAFEGRLAVVALWTPLLYGGAALTGRGWASEQDRGTMEWLMSLPVAAHLHGWSRTLVGLLLMLLLAALSLFLAVVGFGVPFSWPLAAVMALAATGLSLIGNLGGALAAQAKAREILAPILLIPVAAPLVQAGVHATIQVLDGQAPGTAGLLMIGYNLVALGACWLLWPFVLEAD